MTKFLKLAATLEAMLIAAESGAFARGIGGPGASSFAPGHAARVPGTSGAPGRLFLSSGRHSLPGHPGASGYAPGHRFHHR
jgi:hypothetical protein